MLIALAREWREINMSQPFVKDMSKFGSFGSLADEGFATSYSGGDLNIKTGLGALLVVGKRSEDSTCWRKCLNGMPLVLAVL